MFGWIAQWYLNVPGELNVVVNVPPGGIDPEFHAPPSALDVCVVESLFVHVRDEPTATLIGLGA
jgi:hypothetical protein